MRNCCKHRHRNTAALKLYIPSVHCLAMDDDDGNLDTENGDNKPEQTETDDEDDCEGYFLQPVGETIDMSEKIAQANKQLFEEEPIENNEKIKKVQFSEDLVNFEPDIDYESIESTVESIDQSLPEDDKLKPLPEEQLSDEKTETFHAGENIRGKEEFSEATDTCVNDSNEEILEEIPEDILPKIDEKDDDELNLSQRDEENPKLLLILFPQEQNSSCESIIGEDISGSINAEKTEEKDDNSSEKEKSVRTRMIRPKSASSLKYKKSREVPKISPTLNCCQSFERKAWQITKNPMKKSSQNKTEKAERKNDNNIAQNRTSGGIKKINIDTPVLGNFSTGGVLRRCDERPKSSFNEREKISSKNRPKTAPMKRTCCVIKSELPRYNGLRSEYGLSAEQLQERKQTTLQIRNQRKQEKLKERQEELRKKMQNEEVFQKWLLSKREKGNIKKESKKDTLTRSDVYIQNHASYATNRNVPYSINYNSSKKIHIQAFGPKENSKKIVLEKIFDKMTPHYKRSFNIYLGVT